MLTRFGDKGKKLEEFVTAGVDRKWHLAESRIENDPVVVLLPEVPGHKEARHAWQSSPDATLCDGTGLPAAPSGTDDYPSMEAP
jgi:sialate O-acetylesterase